MIYTRFKYFRKLENWQAENKGYLASITEYQSELTMSHPRHALEEDEGVFAGIWHKDCGGKVWTYKKGQECGTCFKTWGETTHGTTNDKTQDKTT